MGAYGFNLDVSILVLVAALRYSSEIKVLILRVYVYNVFVCVGGLYLLKLVSVNGIVGYIWT